MAGVRRARAASAASRRCSTRSRRATSLALTADVPQVVARRRPGIVMLARASGRPIYPVAVTTSRRIELDNWDRSEVNLPFGRLPSWSAIRSACRRTPTSATRGYARPSSDAVER